MKGTNKALAFVLSATITSTPVAYKTVSPIVAMSGKAKIGAIFGAAALGVGAIAAIKVALKTGVIKVGLSSAGKVGIGTLGKTTVGTLGARTGAVSFAELEASNLLKESALAMVKRNTSSLTKREFPELFSKYPELASAVGNSAKVDDLILMNSNLSDDIALAMYKKNPGKFSQGFEETSILKHYPQAFDDSINAKVTSQTSREADEIIQGSLRRLEQEGIDITAMSSMESAQLERVIAETLIKEIEGTTVNSSYQWGYKSGKLFVKGDVGHFSFEQEIAISTITKMAVAGTVVVSGYKYGWTNKKFKRIHTCIDSFCLEIKNNASKSIQPTTKASGIEALAL